MSASLWFLDITVFFWPSPNVKPGSECTSVRGPLRTHHTPSLEDCGVKLQLVGGGGRGRGWGKCSWGLRSHPALYKYKEGRGEDPFLRKANAFPLPRRTYRHGKGLAGSCHPHPSAHSIQEGIFFFFHAACYCPSSKNE